MNWLRYRIALLLWTRQCNIILEIRDAGKVPNPDDWAKMNRAEERLMQAAERAGMEAPL